MNVNYTAEYLGVRRQRVSILVAAGKLFVWQERRWQARKPSDPGLA